MTLRLRRPSPATVIASVALFVAAGGPAEAAKLIHGKQIKRGTVSSKQLRDRGVTVRDLSRGAYRTLRDVPSGAVGPAELAGGAVGPAAIALNGVSGANVADGTLGTADLADSAVTGDKIAANTIRQGDIGAGAVGASEVASGAIRGSEISDGSLDGVDLAEFRGTFSWDVGALDQGVCQSTTQTVTPVRATDPPASVADDIVLVAPEAGRWSKDLTLSVVPQDATTVLVSACNVGGADPIDPASDVTFRYLAIDG